MLSYEICVNLAIWVGLSNWFLLIVFLYIKALHAQLVTQVKKGKGTKKVHDIREAEMCALEDFPVILWDLDLRNNIDLLIDANYVREKLEEYESNGKDGNWLALPSW